MLHRLVSLFVGDYCGEELVTKLNIFHKQCISLLISKGLSFGIVAGGAIVKLPQIAKLLASKSVAGLSFLSYLLEIATNMIALAYNIRMGNAFSTFGEVSFILVQNIMISCLMLHYQKKPFAMMAYLTLLILSNYYLYDSGIVKMNLLTSLQGLTLPIFIGSRIPQILKIWQMKSPGQVSILSVGLMFIGAAARVFTTYKEVNDIILLAGAATAAILNGIILFQIIYYSKSTTTHDSKQNEKNVKKKKSQ